MAGEESYYLELSDDPVRFEAVNQLTNVFFDDSNKDVFAVRSGGVMGVVVKGSSKDQNPLNFRMEDHGPVVSIKFSLDHKILAVQRTKSSIEFMNFNGTELGPEYSQSCKKNAKILGFVWTYINEVAIIGEHGIELYSVLPEKKSLKHLKTTSVTAQWFIWCSASKLVLLASNHGSQLQPVQLKPGTINKLPKLETEAGRMALERDITLATLYGVPSILILRHQSGPQSAEVYVYTMNGPGQASVKSHIFKLGMSGRFAINVVDDLVLVHHQASRSTQVFDISLPGESDGYVKYHTSVVRAKSIKPTSLSLPGLVEPQLHPCELYSPNWVVFQPDIVIDAKLGCLWHIKLQLRELCSQISDLGVCTQVALNRTNSKAVLLEFLLNSVKKEKPPLEKLQEAFNHINCAYRDLELQKRMATPPDSSAAIKTSAKPRVLITQDDIYNEIFQKMNQNDLSRMEKVLICFISSLSECCIPTQHNLDELAITTLAKQGKFTVLQTLLQYRVISDSKPIACLLLSLGNMHHCATQMALDMLTRIGAKDEIQEILLSEGQVMSALKLAGDDVNPRKFLDAAQNSGDLTLFHSVLVYFKNNPQFEGIFKKYERLTSFMEDYDAIFNKDSENT